MIKTAILTISDSCSKGTREDISGQTIAEMLPENKFQISKINIVPDDIQEIAKELINFCDKNEIDIVFTTGGTGLGPHDVTPEATASISDKLVPGISEIIRAEGFKKTPNAALSRGISCIRKNTLIINLPGSPKGVRESLEVILTFIPHAIKMMHGSGH
ncbi:MAG: MogA/MoaB family molybdenum cofactor biosynthesis protein [Sedimentisphaerales bacterium]|nr:MogA/MoaB family molybdenum cofactor biosynthesis protein [Sedimentisphaerales bacterium]